MRLLILFTSILICSHTLIFAQTETVSPKIYNQVSDAEKYAVKINKNDLEKITQTLCSPDFEGRRFGSVGDKKAREYIISELAKRNISKSTGNLCEQYFKENENYGINIIGSIEGYVYPDESIIIACHYDGLGTVNETLFPSADDNATGVAAFIEIAEAFSAAATDNIRPKRSVIFVAFDAGKHDMLGAKIYYKYPIKSLKNIKLLLNMDMLGRDDCGLAKDETDYVFLLGHDKLSHNFRQISDSINSVQTHLKIEYDFYKNQQIFDLFFPTSDHYVFSNTVPAIFYTAGINADVHSPADTHDKISYSMLRRRAQLVYYTAWNYANR
jgi:Zn-dependent M28 family amino/carboxypeptidase